MKTIIDSSATNTQIWVAKGTYKPTQGTDRTVSFVMKAGVALYGGFAGGETSLSQRDWQVNPSILSGDIGLANDSLDNSYHVISSYGSGLDTNIVLDGFTVRDGNADWGAEEAFGGGLYAESSIAVITNCRFTHNYARLDGGGIYFIYNRYSSITKCSFINNTAGDDGGGIYGYKSSQNIIECNFLENRAFSGAGIRSEEDTLLLIKNCSFIGNLSFASGGGVFASFNNSAEIYNCTFKKNRSDNGSGGAIANSNNSPTITNCHFTDNYANQGGAISNYIKSSPAITNCLFAKNNVLYGGGGIMNVEYSSPAIVNCSFVNNLSGRGSGLYPGNGIYNVYSSSPKLSNSIIWGENINQIHNELGGSISANYCIVQGGYPGINDEADPLFIDTAVGDFRLQLCSPALNAGIDSVNITTADLEGNPRKFNVVDLGAYELQAISAQTLYVDSTATGTGDGRSWANAFTSMRAAFDYFNNCAVTDSLLIAKGTYTESNPLVVFQPNMVILGGFPSGGGSRNPDANPVIVEALLSVNASIQLDGIRLK